MSSAFPFPRPITAEDKLSQYRQLRSWSKAASRIKTLAGQALKINVSCTEYRPPSTLPPPTSGNGRKLIHCQVPARFLDPDVDTIYLVKPLRVGNGWPSQVWAASFDPASLDDDATLAVKIYQSSWHPCVKHRTLKTNKHPLLYDKFYEYECEASAYNAYAPLQGSVVPYVRGFYEIELPHGEPAVAMVMERIRKRKASYADFAQLEQAAKGLLDAAFDLYKCGVLTTDLSTNNVLWPINPQTNKLEGYPVFIDFASAEAAPSEGDMCRQAIRCLELLRQYDFDRKSVMDFVRKATAEEGDIGAKFRVIPQYLTAINGIVGSEGWKKEEEYSTAVANA